jgi:hypothetical protein
MNNILNKLTSKLNYTLSFIISFALIGVSLLMPISAAAQTTTNPVEPVPIVMPDQQIQATKIGCKMYAMMIKNLIVKIKTMMEEKIKYYETKIQILYTQLEAAFLAGDMTLYDQIQSQIDALEALLNQFILLMNQTLATLNQALIEASKNPCNLALVKELIKKALGLYAQVKAICDKLMAALDALK